MSKKINRFEKMELDPTNVPKKPTIVDKLKFKRKLEMGNEAQAETINNDLKKISQDLDKQAEENERRRAIIRQQEMVKAVEKARKDEEMDLELRKQFALEKKQKAKEKLWLIGVVLFAAIGLLYFSGRQGRNLILDIIFGAIAVYFGYGRLGRRRRRWDE